MCRCNPVYSRPCFCQIFETERDFEWKNSTPSSWVPQRVNENSAKWESNPRPITIAVAANAAAPLFYYKTLETIITLINVTLLTHIIRVGHRHNGSGHSRSLLVSYSRRDWAKVGTNVGVLAGARYTTHTRTNGKFISICG